MKIWFISVFAAVYLYGASDTQTILNDVAKLRQKYEECRAGQSAVLGIEPRVYEKCENSRVEAIGKLKGYQKRIATLEAQIKQMEPEVATLKKHNLEITHELSQKTSVIRSLEQSLNSRDQKYREAVQQNEMLIQQTNTAKVSRIERAKLTSALAEAKIEIERLRKHQMSNVKSDLKPLTQTTTMSTTDQNRKIIALQGELAKANALITQLRQIPPKSIVQEKIVTKVIEPTEKLQSLERELLAAQATISSLKHNTVKAVPKEKIVEKVVYKEKPVVQERVIEKVVYKDRPIIAHKVAVKEGEKKVIHAQAVVSTSKMAKTTVKSPENMKNTPLEIKPKLPSDSAGSKKQGKSSAYRMATNAPIYDAPGGSQIDTWEARRSFTAGNPSAGWVHITGYFINRVWTAAGEGEELWVRERDVIRR